MPFKLGNVKKCILKDTLKNMLFGYSCFLRSTVADVLRQKEETQCLNASYSY